MYDANITKSETFAIQIEVGVQDLISTDIIDKVKSVQSTFRKTIPNHIKLLIFTNNCHSGVQVIGILR